MKVSIFRCDLCESEINDIQNRDNHSLKEHGIVIMNCDQCDFGALDKSILKRHKYRHTGVVLFTCGICEFEATKRYLLENHIEAKHSKSVKVERTFMCDKCERYFNAFQLKHHKCTTQSKYACEQCTFLAVTFNEAEHTQLLRRYLSIQMRQLSQKSSEPKYQEIPSMSKPF